MRKFWIICLCALGLIGGGGYLAWQFSPRIRQTVQLSSGDTLTVYGVTYGRKHELKLGPNWDVLLQWCPEPIRRHLPQGRNRLEATFPDDCLVVWYRLLAAGHPNLSRAPGLFVCGEDGILCSTTGGTGGVDGIDGGVFAVFSRRSQRLEILFQDPDPGTAVLHRFTIANPAFGRFTDPKWPVRPLPSTEPMGDVQVTLNSLVCEPRLKDRAPKHEYSTRNEIRLTTDQNSAETFWGIIGVETTDATGNHAKAGDRSTAEVGSEFRLRFAPAAMPNEDWKLDIQMARKRGFRPEELATWTNIPVPSVATGKVAIHETRQAAGYNLTLLGIGDARSFSGSHMPSGKGPFVYIRISAPLIRAHFSFVEIRDDQGREIGAGSWGSGNQTYHRELSLYPDSKTLTITAAVREIRSVVFYARPELTEDLIK